jgi:small subunit ribosomal protein S17
MSDDETKKEEIQDDTPQDEAAEAAGPVDAGDPPPPAQQAEVPPTTPPTAEAAEAEEGEPSEEVAEEAPAAEETPATEEAPAAEEAAPAEPDPDADLPWKERRRLQKSRRSGEAGPQLSTEGRVAKRAEERRVRANLRRKQRETVKAERTPGTGTAPAEKDSNAAKVRQGIVVSSKGDKSITVRIDIARRHRTYEKIVRSSTKLHAHDERNEAGEGDVVRVIETRPLSKTKRWRLVDVVEKAR